MTERSEQNALTELGSKPLLSCRVTIGDCSCWMLRVASFVYLHVLAWRVLIRGPQDVTVKTTIHQDNKSYPHGAVLNIRETRKLED